MNGQRSLIKFLENEIVLCKQGLHPDQLKVLEDQLLAARQEMNRQFFEGLDADTKREAQYKPKRRPESCLVPRGYDEWMDQSGNWHVQDCDVRPDL